MKSQKKMKNKILATTKNIIPYIKELNRISGGVLASILMQQLDYWFASNEGGFYKFLKPCDNKLYKKGDSWVEELGFSKDEFSTAFSKIGIRYKSKNEFLLEKDPFRGKFYCSYYDRIRKVSFYFRNHEIADKAIEYVFNTPLGGNSALGLGGNSAFYEEEIPLSTGRKFRFTGSGNSALEYTENTTEITTETTADILSPQAGQDAKIQTPLEDSSKEKEDKVKENVYIFDSNLISVLKNDFVQDWKDYLDFLKKMVRKELETGILIRYTDKWISQIYLDFRKEYGETGLIRGLTRLKKQCDSGIFPYYTKRLLLQFIIHGYIPKVEIHDGHIKYTCACHYVVDLDNESICPKCHSAINDKYIDSYLATQTAV